MERVRAVLTVALAALISGCSPVASIRPLYTDDDLEKPVVEPRIEGEWVSPNSDEPEKAAAGEMWFHWKITAPEKPDAPYSSYSAEFRLAKRNPQQGDAASSYDVRLVAIGDKLFFDAEFSKHSQGHLSIGPEDVLGLVPGHLVGRIWVQRDFLRIALLKPDWVEENWAGGFHKFMSSKYGEDSIVMTGTTQELRDFFARNADNPRALAEVVYLCRPGTDCVPRAAEDALVRWPDDDDVLEGASKFFIARGDYARAVGLRRQLMELHSGNFERRTELGEALLFNRDFVGARRELAAAQKLALGDPPAAVDSLTNYAGSGYAHASEDIVWSYFLEGDYAEAANSAKRYRPDKDHLSATPILLSYFSLLRLGRREAAESLLNGEIAKFRGSAEEHILLLDAQRRISWSFHKDGPHDTFFRGLREIALHGPGSGRDLLSSAASDENDSVVALAAKIELERLGPEPKKKGKD